jgi:hypothetical protein
VLNSGFMQWVSVVAEWVIVGFCWGFGLRWVGVACGGFLDGSRWVAVVMVEFWSIRRCWWWVVGVGKNP